MRKDAITSRLAECQVGCEVNNLMFLGLWWESQLVTSTLQWYGGTHPSNVEAVMLCNDTLDEACRPRPW